MTGRQPPSHGHSTAAPFPGTSRPTLAVGALALGVMGVWMFWIERNALDGNGWFDWIVGLILDELILALVVFACLLLVWALFRPARLGRLLTGAQHELTRRIQLLGIVFGAAVVIVAWVSLALQLFGVRI
jgi:hypothetical protein